MKKGIILFWILLLTIPHIIYGQTPKTKYRYTFKFNTYRDYLPQSIADSTIKVLKIRLIKRNILNTTVQYDEAKREFEINSNDSISAQLITLLIRPWKMSFYEMYDLQEFYNSLAVEMSTEDSKRLNRLAKLVNLPAHINSSDIPANFGKVNLKDTLETARILDSLKKLIPKNVFFIYKIPHGDSVELFGIKNNENILKLSTFLDTAWVANKNNNNTPTLGIKLNNAGDRGLAEFTDRNTVKYVALMVDETLFCTPKVWAPINGGNLEISGDVSSDQIKELADMLNIGVLPLDLILKKFD